MLRHTDTKPGTKMSYTIYKLPPSEFYRYRTHLLSLDEETRYMRFGFHIRNETINELSNRWELHSDKHKVFAIENDNMEVVAVGHVSLEEEPAELAFSVFKEYQGRGMGDALMKRTIEYCQNRGIKLGCMVCLGSNDKIKHLARKHNILVKTEEGEAQGKITIPSPTPASYWHEYIEDSVAKIDHLGKAQKKFAQMFRFPLFF
jgi:GNAT superfamily N-acetyltransferase